MANISQIKLPNNTTYNIKDKISGYTTNTGTVTSVAVSGGTGISISGSPITSSGTITVTNTGATGVKGNAESSYRTGQVNLTSANIGAIPANSNGNTQNLYRPLQLNGCNDNTLDSKINTLRANRLAFLPADQIIIEKTVDGGATWTDAGVADSTKVGLFSETRAGVSIPLIDGSQNINCGLRITITAMKYNVPANTAETNKYNYWNSNYIASTERYNQLKEMYFWVSTSNNSMSIKVERASGANSTSWSTIYDSSANNYGLTGWSGNDYIRFTQGVFGGATTQTGNFWNYRLTFFTRGTNGSTTLNTGYLTSAQYIMEIRGYGDTWWTKGNEYAANDKIYTHDYLQNVTFPGQVNATSFNGYTILSNVPSNAKFTDTVTTATTTGSGNAVTAITASNGALTVTKGSTFLTSHQDISGKADKATTLAGYGITDAKIASGVITLGSNTITPLTSSSTLNAAKLSGAIPSAVTATTQSAGDNSTKVATTAYVDSAIPTVPTNVSAFTNDAGYLTSFTESDPTVPAWAKAVSKPTYTASEVGAQPTLVSGTNIKTINNQSLLGSGDLTINVPTKTSDLTNDSGFITASVATATPTADTISKFDSTAHMNSTDMTAQEVEDFVSSLSAGGGKIFVATIDVTSFSDVEDALKAGKLVFAITSNSLGTYNIYPYAHQNSNAIIFARNQYNVQGIVAPQMKFVRLKTDDTWETVTSTLGDYVVEQGTSGIWTYRKWQSGIAECWGITPTTSYAITSTYGSLYYANATLCTFPTNLFISVPTVNIARTPNGGVGAGLVFAAINSVTTTNVVAYIANSTSGTWNFNFSISAKGRWK